MSSTKPRPAVSRLNGNRIDGELTSHGQLQCCREKRDCHTFRHSTAKSSYDLHICMSHLKYRKDRALRLAQAPIDCKSRTVPFKVCITIRRKVDHNHLFEDTSFETKLTFFDKINQLDMHTAAISHDTLHSPLRLDLARSYIDPWKQCKKFVSSKEFKIRIIQWSNTIPISYRLQRSVLLHVLLVQHASFRTGMHSSRTFNLSPLAAL